MGGKPYEHLQRHLRQSRVRQTWHNGWTVRHHGWYESNDGSYDGKHASKWNDGRYAFYHDGEYGILAQWAWVQAAWPGKATTILAWVAFKAASIWDQLRLRPPSPSPCMGLILKATGIPFKATVNLSMDLGLLNLSIPHRKTPLLRSNLQGNPFLPHNIHSTPNILVILNNLFTSNLSSNLDLCRAITNNLAIISLYKPLTTSTL